MIDDNKYCEWAVREGNGVKYWGHTPCVPGFNPLKINRVGQLKEYYNDRLCPICRRPIRLKGYVFDEDFIEMEEVR